MGYVMQPSRPIDWIRNAIRYTRHSPKRLDVFKKCVKAEKIDSKALLCLDIPTRWNSTYKMLDRAQKIEKAFNAFDLAHPNYRNNLRDGVPKVTDWSYARKLRNLLELFKHKTNNASATKYVTVNMFYIEMMDIYTHIRNMKGIDPESRLMADAMQNKFDKYWGTNNKGLNYILYFAAILDPQSKLGVLSFGFACVFKAEKKERDQRGT
ncbi:zinc finger BED domain-containing protein RICESLEEPER 2-like [Bidens hawaiensis]|uniref:zinc finger BED domain-containing protein RICESLEEPER 2-like n=1 Tax=Bidens hawaiensis TaxID=980011 RepID=UPI00404B35BA